MAKAFSFCKTMALRPNFTRRYFELRLGHNLGLARRCIDQALCLEITLPKALWDFLASDLHPESNQTYESHFCLLVINNYRPVGWRIRALATDCTP